MTAGMLIAGHKLNLSVLLRRAMDICSGLHEVHDMNVEMRDLKPVTSVHGLLMCCLKFGRVLNMSITDIPN